MKTLEEVCTLQRGFDLPKRLREKGSYPLISSSGCIDSHTQAKAAGPGVVTGRSGSIGSVFFIEQDFWPLNTTLYVKDFHGNDPRFIFHLLNSFDLIQFSSGAGVPTLNRNNVHCEPVFIPTSLPEQKRIVAILDEAFAGISQAVANAEKNLANARELFESYLNNVFTQKGEGWVEYQLHDLTTKIGSGATPKGGGSSYKSEGISLIRSLNVHDRNFTNRKLAFIDDEQASKLSNVIVEEGDVLFNITGASVARCCVVPSEYLPARVNQHVSILRPKQEKLSTDFLCYLMTSRINKDILLGIGDEGGSTRQAITKKQLQELVVFIPESKEAQGMVVNRLNELSSKTQRFETIYQQKFTALTELKQSILQKAFTGELTSNRVKKQVVNA